MPPLDPDIADLAPSDLALTPYDQEHAVTYMRLLDADAEGADWREVAFSRCLSSGKPTRNELADLIGWR